MQNRGATARRSEPGYGESAPNFGSARSDYGERAYGGRLNRQGMDRGWWDRATDEVSSWLGDEQAERRRRTDARREGGRGGQRNFGRQNYGGYSEDYYPAESGYYSSKAYRRNWRELRAGDVMTHDVVTVHPNDSVQNAAQLMAECDCGAVPVVDWQGRMLGMITDRDITIRVVAAGADLAFSRVGDCMTDEAFACHVGDSLVNCMRVMSRHQIRRIPIVDDRNRVVGIISQGDLAQHASEHSGRGEKRALSEVVCAVSEPSEGSHS
jgi:CBS domain-containing protein